VQLCSFARGGSISQKILISFAGGPAHPKLPEKTENYRYLLNQYIVVFRGLGGIKMKSYRKVIEVNIPARMAFLNITSQVQDALRDSGIKEGFTLVNAMHITASVFINDDEPGLHEDYARWLEELAPFDPSPQRYHHNRTGEENGDAHHKRQIMGREVVVAVTNGKLDFGPWEQVFYGEFDGRRKKRIMIKIIGE